MEITQTGNTLRAKLEADLLQETGRWRMLERIVGRYGLVLANATGAQCVVVGQQKCEKTGMTRAGIYLDYPANSTRAAPSRLQLEGADKNIHIPLFRDTFPAAGIRVHREVTVRQPQQGNELRGSVTCAVKIRNYRNQNKYQGDPVFIMSCLHVLGMSEFTYPNFAGATEIHCNGQALADYNGVCGLINSSTSPVYSLDAALAQVKSGAKSRLKNIFPTPPLKYAINVEAIRKHGNYKVLGRDGEKHATFRKVYRGNELAIRYPARTGMNHVGVCHRLIIESATDTRSGDSGSAVVSLDGKTLLGMHIAGDDDRNLGYMIPAFELFNARLYQNLAGSDRIKLTDDFN